MTMKWITTAVVLSSGLCWGQARYTIPLVKAQPELAVPTIVTRNGVVYAAYRSFDLLHRSEQLQVASYDLVSHKELRHATIANTTVDVGVLICASHPVDLPVV